MATIVSRVDVDNTFTFGFYNEYSGEITCVKAYANGRVHVYYSEECIDDGNPSFTVSAEQLDFFIAALRKARDSLK